MCDMALASGPWPPQRRPRATLAQGGLQTLALLGVAIPPSRQPLPILRSGFAPDSHRTADRPGTSCLTLSARGVKWTTKFDVGRVGPEGPRKPLTLETGFHTFTFTLKFFGLATPIPSITQFWCGLSRSASPSQVQINPQTRAARNECFLPPVAWIRSISTCKT